MLDTNSDTSDTHIVNAVVESREQSIILYIYPIFKDVTVFLKKKTSKKTYQSFFKKISSLKEQVQCFYWRTDSIFKSYPFSARTDKLSMELVYIVALFRAAFQNCSFQSLISIPELDFIIHLSRASLQNHSFQSLSS
jgi:hypothetical protein